MKRFFRILWLKMIGDWFKVVCSPDGKEWGIYHPWRIHYKATNSTYGEAKLRADLYNSYLIEDNSLGR